MNKRNFDIMMSKFSKIFERTLEPDVLAIYFNICNEIPDSQINNIIRNCLKKCHYFPRPADIFEAYDKYAMESWKFKKTTPEELECSKKVIRKVREEWEKVNEPEKIGSIIKGMDIGLAGGGVKE